MLMGPSISSQHYLDHDKVIDKAHLFRVFIVMVYLVVLRGRQYTMLMDGYHNYAAARLAGVKCIYQLIVKKLIKIFSGMTARESKKFLINNLTDNENHYVEDSEIVRKLFMP
ncbi:hypothetical protein Sant_1155 [Sodalis praecaptivus]|uniref:Uncharacterized protein n=1 Tax=Sodalis praecaptivus TaxID=1239307 RepID=W0HVJ7_9GAMM|nr:hypothetical protein [Sodalis praecaptivus]AHF76225.1 hypothetical protein Sant_1155 [Sodalis praecaptivus]